MQHATTKIRRLAAATVLSIGLGAAAASPVAADPPTTIVDSWTFTDINPCTGDEHDLTINVEAREHRGHSNNFVVNVERTGSTSDGYVMRGSESQQWNDNAAHINLTDTWRNDEGSMFKAQLNVKLKPEGPQVENFRLRCVRP